MSELTLLVLRVGFLLLLWFFIFSILYALRSDLFGAPVRRLKNGSAASVAAPASPPVVSPTPAATPAPTPAQAPTPAPDPATEPHVLTDGVPSAAGASPGHTGVNQLVITSGVATGSAIPLDVDLITIGRSSDSTLVIVDEYTSTYHARLKRTGDDWILTDLDSTNGTKLNGAPVKEPVRVPPYTPVTIGTTTFELRP